MESQRDLAGTWKLAPPTQPAPMIAATTLFTSPGTHIAADGQELDVEGGRLSIVWRHQARHLQRGSAQHSLGLHRGSLAQASHTTTWQAQRRQLDCGCDDGAE